MATVHRLRPSGSMNQKPRVPPRKAQPKRHRTSVLYDTYVVTLVTSRETCSTQESELKFTPMFYLPYVLYVIDHSRPYARSTAFRTCIPALIRPRKYHISTFTGSRLYHMCLSENVGVHIPTCNMIYAHSLASLILAECIALYPATECKW